MKTYLLTFFLFFTYATSAHKTHTVDSTDVNNYHHKDFKNSIIFSGTDYYSPYRFRRFAELLFPGDDQVGIYYNRTLYKNWGVTIGYGEWNSFPWYRQNLTDPFETANGPFIFQPGSILFSVRYKMADAFVRYSFRFYKRWRVHAMLGASYTSGVNSVIDSIYINPVEKDAIIYQSPRKAHYWGIIPALSADYLCLNNRLSLGADVRYRRYFGFYFKCIEYGFHAGFNF